MGSLFGIFGSGGRVAGRSGMIAGRSGRVAGRSGTIAGLSRTIAGLSGTIAARSGENQSTARWARVADLQRLVVGRARRAPPAPIGRLVLGVVRGRVIAAERSQSVIVIGPTQSGKTSGFAVPAIAGWDGPVIAASVKTDLLDHTIDHRRLAGSVQCFDPTGSTGLASAYWSPLLASRTWPGARRSAAALTEVGRTSVGTVADADFWYAAASKMLAPLLFAASFGGGDMADVIRWVDTHEQDEVLDLLESAGIPPAIDAARSTFGKEERQRSSIYTTVETVLEPFIEIASRPATIGVPDQWEGASMGAESDGGPSVRPVSGGTIEPAFLVHGSNTLYLCAPGHDQRRLTPLFVSVVRQVIEYAYEHVTRTRRPLDPPLLLVLDEAANIAPLSDLDALAATAAGHGIQLVTIFQDMAQIHARYGPRSTTVVNNHRAKLFLSGISDPSTLDYASHLIGEEEVVLPAFTYDRSGGSSTTQSPSIRKLAAPDALRRTEPGSGVLVYGSLPPARLRLCNLVGKT